MGNVTSYTLTAAQALTPGHSFTWYVGADSSERHAPGLLERPPDVLARGPAAADADGAVNGITIAASTGYDTPTFTWSSVTGAGSYTLYVVDNTTGQVVVNTNVGNVTSYQLTAAQALTPGHSFTWYVSADGANGTPRQLLGGPPTFTLASVQLTPSNNSTIPHTTGWLTPTFTWVAATEAVSYNVYLIDVTNPNQPAFVYDNSAGNATSYPSPTLTAGHRYQWYVGIVTSSADLFWDGPETFTLAP